MKLSPGRGEKHALPPRCRLGLEVEEREELPADERRDEVLLRDGDQLFTETNAFGEPIGPAEDELLSGQR